MDDRQRVLQIFQTYREVNQAFFHVLTRAAQQHGVTPLQLIVLRALQDKPSCRLSELAEYLNLGNSTTSGIVDRMVKADLVSRKRTEEDRRAITLTLTDKGKRLWKETDETRFRMLAPLSELTDHDRRELERIQQEILRILKKIREVVPHE